MSNLRIATPEDTGLILELMREFHQQSPYSGIEFDDGAAVNTIVDCIIRGVAILSEDHAIIAGLVTPVPFARAKVATEVAWFCREVEGRSVILKDLQEAFEYWARNVAGAKYIWCGSFRHSKYFLDRGYKQAETMYIAELT